MIYLLTIAAWGAMALTGVLSHDPSMAMACSIAVAAESQMDFPSLDLHSRVDLSWAVISSEDLAPRQ